jgi:hypothetical protein
MKLKRWWRGIVRDFRIGYNQGKREAEIQKHFRQSQRDLDKKIKEIWKRMES